MPLGRRGRQHLGGDGSEAEGLVRGAALDVQFRWRGHWDVVRVWGVLGSGGGGS